MQGRCQKCGKMTELGNSCCKAGVEFEGHIYYDGDLDSIKIQKAATAHANKVAQEGYVDVIAAWSLVFDAFRVGVEWRDEDKLTK